MKFSLFGGLAASALAAALAFASPASASSVLVTFGSTSAISLFATGFDSLVSSGSNSYTDAGMLFTAVSLDPTQGINANEASATNQSLTASNHLGYIDISMVDSSIAFANLHFQFANFAGGTPKFLYRVMDGANFVTAGSFSSYGFGGTFRTVDFTATSGHFTDVLVAVKGFNDADQLGTDGLEHNFISIDNVGGFGTRISTAVPEPSTWALMLLGFGTMGAMLRNQRRTLQTASA